jgi:nucleoside phosphorylase
MSAADTKGSAAPESAPKGSGSPRRAGVIIAVEEEARAILGDLRFAWEELPGGEYRSAAFPVRLRLSGVGKVFAAWACAALAPECDLILSLGTSGGLSSEKVGSLRLVREFVEHDMDARGFGYPLGVTPSSGSRDPVVGSLSPAIAQLAYAALEAAGLRSLAPEDPWARAASGDRFIMDASESRALREATGASLCDMESAAIAKLCSFRARRAGSPLDFFALRAVSDNADHKAQISWDAQVKLSAKDFDEYLYAFAKLL